MHAPFLQRLTEAYRGLQRLTEAYRGTFLGRLLQMLRKATNAYCDYAAFAVGIVIAGIVYTTEALQMYTRRAEFSFF